MTQELVRAALELYGSGGKNNPVIVAKYEKAVDELNKRMINLIQELSDPTRWIDLRDDEVGRKRFKAAFKAAAKQLNIVKQYYEFVWDNKRFGLDEHKWLQYVGAYRNLFSGDEVGPEEEELSNLGEHEMAESLKRFVNEELVGGHIPATSNFDEAFQDWQDKQQFEEVKAFASEWGIDADLLSKSLKEYSLIKPEEIPFRDDISKTLDPDKATNIFGGNKLMLNMKLGPVLQKWMRDIKQKYK